MDFSSTKISLRRSVWSYSKVQRGTAAINRYIYGIPTLRWGTVRNISKANRRATCDYVSRTDHGLYSNISTTLEDVLTLRRNGFHIRRIDYSMGMNSFKDQPGKDVYPEFFDWRRLDTSILPKGLVFDAYDVGRLYKQLPLAALREASLCLFSPSPSVIETANELARSSGVVPERSIALLYRGTDKSTESQLAAVEEFIGLTESILHASAEYLSVIVQTDQEQVRDKMMSHFGARCQVFSQLPVTRGDTVMHRLDFGNEIRISREVFAKRMMAAALVLSRCAYVITYTGNVGAWVAIYRGTSKALYQFDVNGQLQVP